MLIRTLFKNAAANLRTLNNRLTIQAKAQRDVEEQRETVEHALECHAQAVGLTALEMAYGPVLQHMIDLGEKGVTHRIVLQIVDMRPDDSETTKWLDVSEHIFEIQENKT